MIDIDTAWLSLHRDLGLKRLRRTWAKAEILLGLLAAALGLLLGDWAVPDSGAKIAWPCAVAGILLIVLGGYLAMAGHRSHIYQSMNRLAAYLAAQVESPRSPHARPQDPEEP